MIEAAEDVMNMMRRGRTRYAKKYVKKIEYRGAGLRRGEGTNGVKGNM